MRGDKIFILVIKADLGCRRCRVKIRKCLCQIQYKENISGITYDDNNDVVEVSGRFDPYELKTTILRKLRRVIKGIDIRDPEQEKKDQEEKDKKEQEEKEKKEKEEKEEKEKKEKEEKEKKEKEDKEKEEAEKKKCEPPAFVVKGPVQWPQAGNMICCWRPGPCPRDFGWSSSVRYCSCGAMGGGGSGPGPGRTYNFDATQPNYNYGATQPSYNFGTNRPNYNDQGCNSYKIEVQDYPTSGCNIM